MEKRLVRKLDLELVIAEILPHPSPKAYLEQYTVCPKVATEILYLAAYTYADIIGKKIVDLGCGTGRLAIGAVLLGAEEATGVDIDKTALKTAQKNSRNLAVRERTHWIMSDLTVLKGNFDTVLQNPPFGVQKKTADRKFIKKALELAHHVYSLHKSGRSNRRFMERFIEQCGGKVTGVFPLEMTIPKLFRFHKKQKHVIEVDLYRIEGKVYA
jgi:putative methylase